MHSPHSSSLHSSSPNPSSSPILGPPNSSRAHSLPISLSSSVPLARDSPLNIPSLQPIQENPASAAAFIPPTRGFSVSFHNLSIAVPARSSCLSGLAPSIAPPKPRKSILTKLNGFVPAGSMCAILGGSGSGKCWARGSMLMTADGRALAVESIAAGQTLLGDDGQIRTVNENSLVTGSAPLFEIVPDPSSGQESLFVNGDHILVLRSSLFAGLLEISVSDYLQLNEEDKSKLKMFKPNQVDFILPSNSISFSAVIQHVLNEFGHPTDPAAAALIVARLIGICVAVEEKIIDTEIRNQITTAINSIGMTDSSVDENFFSRPLFAALQNSSPLFNSIVFHYGIIANYQANHSLPFPLDILCSPLAVRRCLLSGILIGTKNSIKFVGSGSIEIVIIPREIARILQFLTRSVGLKIRPAGESAWIIEGLSIAEFPDLTFLPWNEPLISKETLNCWSFRVDPLTAGEYLGFTVSGPNSRFLMADFSVTHNTSLLTRLSNRFFLSGLDSTGDVLVNGVPLDQQFFAKFCAFVPQQSILLSSLTARESIEYASSLRLPKDLDSEFHRANASSIIAQLRLKACADTRIGGESVGGISGGERRRVNVAIELAHNPVIIILDEPTTGLDSDTALAVVKTLRSLTRPIGASSSGEALRTIIATIHQPTLQIFSEFDYLILLAGGGLVYCGPSRLALEYFQSEFGLCCPQNCNPPEFFLDLISPGSLSAFRNPIDRNENSVSAQLIRASLSSRLNYFLSNWRVYRRNLPKLRIPKPERARAQFQQLVEERNSSLIKRLAGHKKSEKKSENENEEEEKQANQEIAIQFPSLLSSINSSSHDFCREFLILYNRSQLCRSRSPLIRLFQFLQSVGLAILIGATFFQIASTRAGIQNRLGVIYFLLISVLFSNLFSAILSFTEERAVFLREQANSMYSIFSYFLSRTAGDIGPTVLFNSVFALLVYLLIGFSRDSIGQFVIFTLFILGIAFCGQSLGLMVSASIESRLTAMLLAPIVIAPFILFTPYSLPDSIEFPRYYLPLKYLSPYWWSFSGLAQNEFMSLALSCNELEKVDVGELIGIPSLALSKICVYTRGKQILTRFGIEAEASGEIWKNFAVLLALSIAYRVIAGIQLRRAAQKVRN